MGSDKSEDLRAREILEHEGTSKVGDYKPLRSGSSVGGLIPYPFNHKLGAYDADEIETYVNPELGTVVLKLPNGVELDDEE